MRALERMSARAEGDARAVDFGGIAAGGEETLSMMIWELVVGFGRSS